MNPDDPLYELIRKMISGKHSPVLCWVSNRSIANAEKRKKFAAIASIQDGKFKGTDGVLYNYAIAIPMGTYYMPYSSTEYRL